MFTMNVGETSGGGIAIDLIITGTVEAFEFLGALEDETPPEKYKDAENVLVRGMEQITRLRAGILAGVVSKPVGWPDYLIANLTGGTVTVMDVAQ